MKIFDKKGISLLATLVFVAMLSVACSGGGGDDGDSLPDGGGGGDTTPDTTAPQLSSFSPADSGQINVATHSVSVTFDEAIDPLTVTGSSFWVESGTSCSDSSAAIEAITPDTSDNKTFTLSFSADWTDAQSYTTCVTTDIKDSAGNALEAAQSATWSATSAQILGAVISKVAPVYSGGSAVSFAEAGNAGWLEITINDTSLLTSGWKVRFSQEKYINDLLTESDLPSGLTNGDIIRVIANSWTGTTDTNKSDNNASSWDIKTSSSYFLDNRRSIVWIENGDGTIVDFFGYIDTAQSDSVWVLEDNDNPKAILDQAVSDGIWHSIERTDQFDLNDATANYAQLKTGVSDGNSPSDWEAIEPAGVVITDKSASPSSVENGTGGSVKFTVSINLSGGATITGVNIDLSSFTGGSSGMTMYDDGTNGDDTANDGIYSLDFTIDASQAVNNYTLAVSTTGSSTGSEATNSLSFSVAAPGACPVGSATGSLAFANSDAEVDMHNSSYDLLPSGSDYTTANCYAGGRALHITGTSGSNFYAFSSPDNMNAPSGATTLTFYLKGTAGKSLSINLGGSGQKCNLDNVSGADMTDLYDGTAIAPEGSNSYAGGSINLTNWTKIVCDISSLSNLDTDVFGLKGGSGEAYDLYVDEFRYE